MGGSSAAPGILCLCSYLPILLHPKLPPSPPCVPSPPLSRHLGAKAGVLRSRAPRHWRPAAPQAPSERGRPGPACPAFTGHATGFPTPADGGAGAPRQDRVLLHTGVDGPRDRGVGLSSPRSPSVGNGDALSGAAETPTPPQGATTPSPTSHHPQPRIPPPPQPPESIPGANQHRSPFLPPRTPILLPQGQTGAISLPAERVEGERGAAAPPR